MSLDGDNMSSVSPSPDQARGRRRTTNAIKESLRALSTQLSLLNHQVGAHLELKDVDFDCLDLVNRHGPLSPSALARRAGLHPATMTGILDRLERGGWVARAVGQRPADRGPRRGRTCQASTGVSTKTGIKRSVFVWYSS
jgi:DNA-binding MarR family transcriptional regulator